MNGYFSKQNVLFSLTLDLEVFSTLKQIKSDYESSSNFYLDFNFSQMLYAIRILKVGQFSARLKLIKSMQYNSFNHQYSRTAVMFMNECAMV